MGLPLGWFFTLPAASAAGVVCPEGMVAVAGAGRVGMRGQPYGIVATAHLEKVDAPEKDCPAAIARTPGASACWVQTDLVDPVIPVHAVEVAPFCIEAYPLPGKGHPYPTDGLSVWDAHQLDRVLASGRFGSRRLCTTTEFQAAVAGLKSNRRFVFGDIHVAGVCEGDTIGADSRCMNTETGVWEYGAVHSHWTRADSVFIANACPSPPCRGAGNRELTEGMYIVAGGTDRAQTRQAPHTPHTWHDHGEPTQDSCGFHGWDDQPVICADPGPEEPAAAAAWASFIAEVRESGSLRRAISTAAGRPICP